VCVLVLAGCGGAKTASEKTAEAAVPANMVLIKGGSFTMGSPADEQGHDSDEKQYQVTLSAFYMGKYPVTQKEYLEVMGYNHSYFESDEFDLPVENVSWYDAAEFCNRLSEREGLTPA
jgi:formylglycine-generating enzyme required for sulfatase activity